MRLALVLLLTAHATLAHASSPAFPICDAEPDHPGQLIDGAGLAPFCPIRWLEDQPLEGGVRIEVWRAGQQIAAAAVPAPVENLQPERRHECDGSIVDTQRAHFEYVASFPEVAQDGDEVRVLDAAGVRLATTSYTGNTCTRFDWAPAECQVCGPESSMGCADAGAGRTGAAGAILVALACVLAGRRRRA